MLEWREGQPAVSDEHGKSKQDYAGEDLRALPIFDMKVDG